LKPTSWVIAVGLLAPGCDLATNGTHNVLIEMHQRAEDRADRKQAGALAERAWAEVQCAEPGHPYSGDYAAGFETGFTDYVYAGGSGEPPAVPPRRYWKSRYDSPEGHQAVEDWFAGFRHGAGVARQGGYRQWVTLPSSLTDPAPAALGAEVAAGKSARPTGAGPHSPELSSAGVSQASLRSSGTATELAPRAKVVGVTATLPAAKVLGVVCTPEPRARVVRVTATEPVQAPWRN
jgi:hypothetical protein